MTLRRDLSPEIRRHAERQLDRERDRSKDHTKESEGKRVREVVDAIG